MNGQILECAWQRKDFTHVENLIKDLPNTAHNIVIKMTSYLKNMGHHLSNYNLNSLIIKY